MFSFLHHSPEKDAHQKISILIIAHDEEAHIGECLESITLQTKKPSEIILVAHNCSDRTVEIARKFSGISLYELHTQEEGPIHARKYGFEKTTGDIIACLDGDSSVCENWFSEITKPFSNQKVVSVAGYPILIGFPTISKIWFLQGYTFVRPFVHFYFWGRNFACRKNAYEAVGGMKMCEEIGRSLSLNYPAEDGILSFLLLGYDILAFAPEAKSWVHPGTFFDGENRGEKQKEDYKKIRKYFKK